MLIDFYFDYYSGMNLDHACANHQPGVKPRFAKRFKFIVDIPDPHDADHAQAVMGELEEVDPQEQTPQK